MTKNFEFNKENLEKAKAQFAKYPKGREVSAIKALLDLAQRQNDGWLSKEAMDYISKFLNIAPIRVYEVATFYTMFNLKPVGKFVVNICTTTPCMLRGAEQILEKVKKHLGCDLDQITADKFFTVKEVECLGACVNAPVAMINDDFYEDLSEKSIIEILKTLKEGRAAKTGSQIGRNSSEPEGFNKK